MLTVSRRLTVRTQPMFWMSTLEWTNGVLFRISGVTIKVSSCTKFQIFRGAEGAYSPPPDPLAGG